MRTSPGFLTLALFIAGAVPAGAQQVASVQLSHSAVKLAVGQRQGVYATANDANGVVVLGQRFDWSSSNPEIVRIELDPDQPDLATLVGVREGLAKVEVRVGSRSATLVLQVSRDGETAPPARAPAAVAPAGPRAPLLRIDPNNILLLPFETRSLGLLFLREDGSAGAPTPVTWRSLNPSVATVNEDGVVVGMGAGRGAIEARSTSGLVAVASIEVANAEFGFGVPVLSVSPGVESAVPVVVPAQGNRPVVSSALSWRSSDETIVRVSPLGVALGVTPGRATITAEGLGQSHTVPVTVHRPVAELRVTPGPSRGLVAVPLTGSVPFTAQSVAGDGSPVPDAPVLWTVRDTSVAVFNTATGTLEGLAVGRTELHVRGAAPGLEATWEVQVIAGGLLATPARVGLGTGDTVSLTASFTDLSGRAISPAVGVAWSSTDPAVVSVAASGVITGGAPGHAGAVAKTSWGKADTVDVFVQGAMLFTSTRSGSGDLYAVDPASPGLARRVTAGPATETMGSYSPDGASIAYVSNETGNFEVYVANADGSDPRRLTTTPAMETSPSWTPDGRQLVYASQAPGARMQVWIMNADGSDPRPLTTGEAANFEPAVSPDGETIAFTSTRDGNYEVYLMGRDGASQRNVSRSAFKESHPKWFSNGALAYIQERNPGARVSPIVVRHDLAVGEVTPLTPPELAVTDFAISGRGDLLALEVSSLERGGTVSRRLMLFPLGAGAAPSELPREGTAEQQSSPAFRHPVVH
jgi:hypothetical protein